MAQLKRSEKILLGVFLLGVFGLINFVLFSQYQQSYSRVAEDYESLEMSKLEIDGLLDVRDGWDRNEQWLDQNQPVYANEADAQTALFNEVLALVSSHGLTLEDQGLLDNMSNPHFDQVSARFKVVGDFRAILEWLEDVQQPSRFRAITHCELTPKSKNDPSVLQCEARVEYRYLPVTS